MDKQKQGKKNRQAGARFELKVRSDLESKGWIVDRWTNNVELDPIYRCCGDPNNWKTDYGRRALSLCGEELSSFQIICNECGEDVSGDYNDARLETDIEGWRGKLIKAKSFMGRSRTNGFPDFIAFKIAKIPKGYAKRGTEDLEFIHEVIGVEVKSNGYLDKTEKEKCKWLLDNQIFSKIIIASKSKERGEINYKEFLENQ